MSRIRANEIEALRRAVEQYEAIAKKYRHDKRVLVYCRPEGAQEIRRELRAR